MREHENKRSAVCRTKSMLNAYAWWCNDSRKMWCGNMIMDKCRNDMFIMISWREAYAWYECIYGHESPENHLFLLVHSGVQCPMSAVKKVIWTFRLPMKKDETNIQCMCDDMMQMRKSETRGWDDVDVDDVIEMNACGVSTWGCSDLSKYPWKGNGIWFKNYERPWKGKGIV